MFQKILISKKSLLGLERKELFCKSLYRNIQYPYFFSKAVRSLFSGLLERCKCQIVFPPVPNTVETPGFYSSTFVYSRFPQRFSFFTICLVQWLCGVAPWWTLKGKLLWNLGLENAVKCTFLGFFYGLLEFYLEFWSKVT